MKAVTPAINTPNTGTAMAAGEGDVDGVGGVGEGATVTDSGF